MAKLYFGVESAALTFKAERDFSDENLGLIMAALAADPQLGFVETVVDVPRLDGDGKPVLDDSGQPIIDHATQRNPATPEQIAQAIGDKTLNDLLAQANGYHRSKAVAEAAAAAEAQFTPIEPA